MAAIFFLCVPLCHGLQPQQRSPRLRSAAAKFSPTYPPFILSTFPNCTVVHLIVLEKYPYIVRRPTINANRAYAHALDRGTELG